MIFTKKENLPDIYKLFQERTQLTDDEMEMVLSGKSKDLLKEKLHVDFYKAADILWKALCDGKRICIVGDYDVDGIAATAILQTFLFAGQYKVDMRLPKRFTEGYGLSAAIVDDLGKLYDFIVTLDNGIAAKPAIDRAMKNYGYKVLVTDHHIPGNEVPECEFVLDHHFWPEEHTPYCGAGTALMLCIAMYQQGYITKISAKTWNKLICFAGIATVADVVPLIRDNYWIVRQSLAIANGPDCPPTISEMAKLMQISTMTASDYAFSIGPCLNASSRLADTGAVKSLDTLVYGKNVNQRILDNQLRKDLTDQLMKFVEDNMADVGQDRINVIYDESFDRQYMGLMGLVAGKICEKYAAPAIALCRSDVGILHGSARSIEGVNIKEVLDRCDDLLISHGGHAQAAGLSLYEDKLPELRQRLAEMTVKSPSIEEMFYDYEVSGNNFTEYMNELTVLAPFGEGNPEPRFHTRFYTSVHGFNYMGNNNQHVKVFGPGFDVIAFNLADQFDENANVLDVVGTLSVNTFKGKTSNIIRADAIRCVN